MKFKKAKQSQDVGGDMTPMIDMTFQLIAFFMVLINFSKNEHHQEIQLPDSVLAKPPDDNMEEVLIFHLTKEGNVVFHGQPAIPVEGLGPYLVREADALRDQRKSVGEATIVIRGHKDVPAGRVQELIQACQEHRFEKFALRAKEDLKARP